jgi:hypothetical protein
MQANNDKGTVYIFRECGTGNLLLETTDMSVISGVVPSNTIARTEKVIIKGVSYIVVAFEIDISGTVSVLNTNGRPMQTEPTDSYGIRTLIYLKKSINPIRNFFLQIRVKG